MPNSSKQDKPSTKSIRIALEAGYDPGWPAGFNYIRSLAHTLSSLPINDAPLIRILPLDKETLYRTMDLRLLPNIEIAVPRWWSATSLLLRRVLRKSVQPIARRPLIAPYKDIDVSFPDWGKPLPGVVQIPWIQDLQHVHLPHLFPIDEVRSREERIARIADRRCVVVLSSQTAAADFLRLHPKARATPMVWSFCSSITEEVDAEAAPGLDLPEVYIYCPNQFWAHKDHITLFQAVKLLAEGGNHVALVCSGLIADNRNSGYIASVQDLLKEPSVAQRVKVLGFLERQTQFEVLRRCAVVVQPSLFEGWSTVIEDAKAVGRPIIASDIDIHLEQAPDAIFFRTGSAESLADRLKNFLHGAKGGPDQHSEKRAREETKLRRIESANRFLEICRVAINQASVDNSPQS